MEPVDLSALAGDPEPRFVEIAKDQRDARGRLMYKALPALVYNDGKILTEWRLTEAERGRLVAGETIRLWIATGGRPMQPICLEITDEHKP